MEIVTYPDTEALMMQLAGKLSSQLREHLLTNDSATLAVPGGTTPGPIFDNLCDANLDWTRINVMLTDERWVPEDSDRSNTALLRRRLLTGRAAAATYVPLYADAPAPEHKLDDLQANLATTLPLSVCLLGMGADMHTASIFPGADQLDRALTGDDTLVAMRAPGAPEPRITLSAKVLRAAMHRHIVIIGDEKRDALERARTLTPQEAPVAAILDGSTVHWAKG
ncbi:6-phosphogluconolactonase [Loktanella sp. TSTF-M6]|uniref:6-phosphogluconolactonase n=1 Tax=Loktanella gaetbuli TaxID=2881335 RepID=A0ABS8BPV6_9RHOB|nr:6-phosphogluconolactonase [Loktanella gaetbuli]MCB5197758.1 6-phosphogluconolactonase [Loktanella gaetbuli]